ncbi:DUF952 domain-containing protein [Palleronia caenipelagi]|uniref:DUF952 domain-containing protein n=1 Tax=Palleronia caenipelagi TaxID=2489174 RepID=A0A547Q7D2_9RHOB|nr:DUF952 domain-containing protein [Palleronia caenipelagi]TRD22295.1 DUF952 domain-containing protein [Palleronia caenipelagi]
MQVYKIFRQAEWDVLDRSGATAGSADDVRDGFIHFSTADQTPKTLEKHFAGETELILAALETDALGDALRWEISRGGQEFPHLYRELNREEVLWHAPIPTTGVTQLLEGKE